MDRAVIRSPYQSVASAALKRLKAGRRSTATILLCGILVMIALVAAFSPLLTPYDANDQNLDARLESPSLSHPLGTDHLGRDVLSRLLAGSRFSLAITTVSVLISGIAGTLVGAISGRAGGTVDEAVMRVVDVVLVFPDLVVAFALASLLKPSFATIVLAVTIFAWTPYARLARAVTLEVNTREFMEAAVALGSTPLFILRRHVLPNIMGPDTGYGIPAVRADADYDSRAVVPRSGRATPHAGLGSYAVGGAAVPAPRAFSDAYPGGCYLCHGAERDTAGAAPDVAYSVTGEGVRLGLTVIRRLRCKHHNTDVIVTVVGQSYAMRSPLEPPIQQQQQRKYRHQDYCADNQCEYKVCNLI